MFLFKPHRSARDYRGIRQEFSATLFQESHLVSLYHAAAFGSYRADFAIRNKRIPSAWGIFKYYALSAAGYKLTEGKEVFSLKKAKQEQVYNGLIDLFRDEGKLVGHYSRVADILEKMIQANGITTRERTRDFLRTEGVAQHFEEAIAKT